MGSNRYVHSATLINNERGKDGRMGKDEIWVKMEEQGEDESKGGVSDSAVSWCCVSHKDRRLGRGRDRCVKKYVMFYG